MFDENQLVTFPYEEKSLCKNGIRRYDDVLWASKFRNQCPMNYEEKDDECV